MEYIIFWQSHHFPAKLLHHLGESLSFHLMLKRIGGKDRALPVYGSLDEDSAPPDAIQRNTVGRSLI